MDFDGGLINVLID